MADPPQLRPGPGQNPTLEELAAALVRETGDSPAEIAAYIRRKYPNRAPRGVSLTYLVAQYEADKENQQNRVGLGVGSLNVRDLVDEITDSWEPVSLDRARQVAFDANRIGRINPNSHDERIRRGRELIYELIHGQFAESAGNQFGVNTSGLSTNTLETALDQQTNPDVQYAWDNFTYGDSRESRSPRERDIAKDPIQLLLGVGRSEAMRVIRELDHEDFIALQHRLFQAGLYGDKVPAFGVRGTAEQTALDNLMIEAMNRGPGMGLASLVDQLTEERMFENSRGLRTSDYASWLKTDDDRSTDEINVLTAQPIETYESTVDSVAMALMGMTLDPTARRDLAVQLRNKDLQSQRSLYAANDYVNERLSETNSDSAELEAFLKAVASVESGGDYFAQNESSGAYGKYQFMPQYWSAWARQAGLPSNADIKDPRNQEIVARYLATSYYRDYGNWYDVAVAWNGGPRRVGGTSLSQGIANYANTVVQRKNQYQQESVVNGVEGTSRDPVTGEILVEAYDGMSEAQRALRVARSDDIYAYSFAQQAQQFFSLLGGVV